MRSHIVVAAVLALSAASSACRGEQVLPAAEMPLALSLWTAVGSNPESIVVYVAAATRNESGVPGHVRVSIPAGMELTGGDTSFTVPARRVLPPRVLNLRAVEDGTYGISAALSAGDETKDGQIVEAQLSLIVEGDSLSGGPSELVRAEVVSDGRRYRHAGFWLVPIQGEETFSPAEFARTGSKPRPLDPIVAHCLKCTADVDSVTFVVVVDRSGKATQTRALDESGDPEVIRAAAEAIADARFQPARYGGRAVTDWVHLRIPIVRSR